MSRKTIEIKKSIENMSVLQRQLSENVKNQTDDVSKKNQKLLDELELEIKNISTWFDMIYKYNGKSRSNSKVTASRENGKKGGRPPKIITDQKKQLAELQNQLSEIHSKKLSVFNADEEMELSEKENSLKMEIENLEDNIERLTLLRKQEALIQEKTGEENQ